MQYNSPLPYVTHPPMSKLVDLVGRVLTYAALAMMGVAGVIPGTSMNTELTPGAVFYGLLATLAIASTVALVGAVRNSYFTEAYAIGFVFLGFTPILIRALSNNPFDLDSAVSVLLAVTILIRWNILSNAIYQARKLKVFDDDRGSRIA